MNKNSKIKKFKKSPDSFKTLVDNSLRYKISPT